ncbi:hypothetical protein ACFZB9_02760 [Kitasatospora sp. NPDC008050]|uniref:hypothetical protein n=1 Tax=Kitasatospora sp. NPDC008050 TaxID=3364021 RepID=UPI0036E67788
MSTDSTAVPLDPTQALALAERAQAAAVRPRLMPGWYGPVIGAVLAGYGVLTGVAQAYDLTWLMILDCVLMGLGIGLAVQLAARSTGVVNRPTQLGGWRGFVFGGTGAVVLAAGVGGAIGWAVRGDALGADAAAGVAAGLAMWVLTLLANRRARREPAAA